ncbi:hypothetical protein IBT49_24870 [Erwinia sp. S63]|uniref:hypothetical protein n=1 Tax=Erwinia sp. S63 TaxID=2769341 RepID=UPI00190B71F6|nr:hypothetical protein [Erwinia sp. S63]MBK0099238.1 hypothetical protein [Erwinia sp. S63]
MIIIAGLFLISGCQQLPIGINAIDSSIQSLNQKLSPNSDDKKINKSEDFTTAQRLNGLKEICTDYTNNQKFAEKKWTGKTISIKNGKIIRASEFNSAKTLDANVHGEYGILFKTSDTNKFLARLHIQYHSGLENDIMRLKKVDSVNLSAKNNGFSALSNWSEYTSSEGSPTVVDLTGVISNQ